MVSKREMVYQTLRFEQPESCPYYVWIDNEMVEPLAKIYGPEKFIGPKGGTRTFAGSYTAMMDIRTMSARQKGQRFVVDEYGAEIQQGSIEHVEKPALLEPSLKGYKFPDMASDEHFKDVCQWAATHAERFKIVQLTMLFWERTWFMRGMENIMMDLYLNPSFVNELLDGLEVVCTAVIDRLLKDHGQQIDAIGFSEDYGTEKALMISPEKWREFIKPRLRRMVQRIRSGGKLAYLHSCGHVRPVIPDLVEIGVNMLQPLQPEAMDIFEIKREFGRDLCLIGGISTQKTLPFGSVEDVKKEVATCLKRMATGGGYVMAPAKAILPGVPVQNARALIDAFVNQGS